MKTQRCKSCSAPLVWDDSFWQNNLICPNGPECKPKPHLVEFRVGLEKLAADFKRARNDVLPFELIEHMTMTTFRYSELENENSDVP